MSKYINADRIKSILGDVIFELQKENQEAQASIVMAVLNGLNEMPESIVRCKDCKYRSEHAGADFWKCENHGVLFKPTDFCSYGKRRESDVD